MHIEVSTDNSIGGSEAFSNLIKVLVQHELAHFDEHITRIKVRLSEARTGPTGQEDKHCLIEGRLKRHQPVVAKHAAATLDKAAKGAADKLKSSLESTLGKLLDSR